VGRARLRHQLAAADEALTADPGLAAADEALTADPGLAGPAGTALRAEVARVGRIGDHLVARAEGARWATAVRRENRWLRAAIAVSATLAIAAAVRVAARRPPAADVLRAGLVLAVVLIALGVAVALRYARYRRTLHKPRNRTAPEQ
jgi:hypothetical protein